MFQLYRESLLVIVKRLLVAIDNFSFIFVIHPNVLFILEV